MAQESVLSHGGRYLVAGPTPGPAEGTWDSSRFVVIEFPAMDRIREWRDSRSTGRPAGYVRARLDHTLDITTIWRRGALSNRNWVRGGALN
ncbi:DUF1330 domain-containing protein [Streptomyces sp. NPDC050422]|uniref:DUF1330 domain-containing protein n=1 Tax=Streptomyces sp. NPDC050422 TaxID=3365614 RepID=UPI0037A108F4